MKIHKAGYDVIFVVAILLILINAPLQIFQAAVWVKYPVLIASVLVFLFVVRFFRFPNRKVVLTDHTIITPADGKVVAIEEVDEKEFINGKRTQVSIFMSVWSVHINWYPILGKVVSSEHFSGRYMAAWLPKSSTENERAVVVVETEKYGKILIRQIAGAVARRIITYAKPGDQVNSLNHLGFIRFGSRVDVLLPDDFEIQVKIGDMVTGGITQIAKIKSQM